MNRFTLVRRSLRFYRRTSLGVVAGCAISAAVLCGALFVGDSVRGSLREIALARLGNVQVALDSGNRYFRDDLASRVGADFAPALAVPGMAIREGKQSNRVEVMGVDARFFALAPSPAPAPVAGKVALNRKLAEALGAKVGDDVRLRMSKPGLLSRDAPLASRKERETRNLRLTVVAVLDDAQLGRFSLKSDQASPAIAFVELKELQSTLDMEGRANLVVGSAAPKPLADVWTLDDAGLGFRTREPIVQLESRRVYLDPEAAAAALGMQSEAIGTLSYLVDEIASERGKSTPYSFMAALAPGRDRTLGPVPADMKDDEILINRWVADELAVKAGDSVSVAYSEFSAGDEFVKKRRTFKVRGVLEMAELAAERELAPEFPGLTDVDTCQKWDVGYPMDEEKLKDPANEAYWKKYKQTPKGLVTLRAGQEMWGNRYGTLMAVRFSGPAMPLPVPPARALAERLRPRIDPGAVGLAFRPVREEALRAASESMDLGQLFLGMSIFLIAASLVLTAMLFVFSVEQRAREMGVLRAVGYSPGRVRGLFLAEGAALAAIGSVMGIPLGSAFARLLIGGLGSAWSGAVAGTPVSFHAAPGSAAVGAAAAAVVSLLAMAIALWKQAKRPVRELVADDFTLSLEQRSPKSSACWRRAFFIGGVTGAIAVIGGTLASGSDRPAGAFFGAGALLLVGGIALVRILLARMEAASSARLTVGGLGVRNAARRPGRGMATAGMLASGCFVVLSVSAFKEDLSLQAGVRRSGTGGFALYGESSVAVVHDLNSEKGRKEHRLADAELLRGVSVVPLRVREGDDASCLNLNQSLEPPLLGVDAEKLARLGAFAEADLWKRLDESWPDGAIPALVGDSATAMWKLRKKADRLAGDVLDYRDERGTLFKVKLVGTLPERLTVLQGRLLISQQHFTRLFPSGGGYRLFLIDAPPGKEERVKAYLMERMETTGLELVRSVDRLKEFYAVESAYLTLFLALGGLGLLLGSAGMAVLVLRNVLERRSELALLRAVGYTSGQTERVVMAEHRFLLAAGLAIGTLSAAIAVSPALLRPDLRLPYGLLAAFLLGTLVLSLLWIRLAATVAIRTPLLRALRSE
jgi:putative ABC transport system permease protein